MNRTILKIGFIICFLFTIWSAWLKIIHADNADTFLIWGLIAYFICFAYVLYDVLSSPILKRESKLIWLTALLVIGWPVMLFYIFTSDNHLHNNSANNLPTTQA